MKHNQKGFSTVEAIVIIVIIGLLSIGCWFVWQKQKDAPAKNTTTTNNNTSENQVSNQVPEGYILYENKEGGFSFAYPDEWEAPQMADTMSAAVNAIYNQELLDDTSKTIKGTMQVYTAKPQDFTVSSNYKAAVIKPEVSGNTVSWKVVEPGSQQEEFSAGDTFTPNPKVIYEKGGLTVYEFPTGHANTAWNTLVFQSGDIFVGIMSPLFHASNVSQETFDAEQAAFNKTLLDIAKTIRTE